MLNRIIRFSVNHKLIIGLFTLGLIGWGLYSASRLPVDALPDITNNQVQIITTSPKLATQEVEKFITYPIELELKSTPGLVELRSVSRFGLSLITVVFEEDIDIYWARAQITERLLRAQENIPQDYGKPFLAPVSTGLGEIYQYTVFPEKGYEDVYSAYELRTIQDWIIVPQLLGIPGVAEVNTLGGKLKQYEVAVNPDRLKSLNVTINEIFDALTLNNENTGGAYIDQKPNAYFIRGVGLINSLEEINKIVVKVQNDIPILIRDVAEVRFGHAVRYGATTKNGNGEVVSGMVMMLKGENSAQVVTDVKDQVEKIKETLPEGVTMEPFLDRSKLVDNAIGTVEKNLIEGALIVIFILVLLIGNWRAGLIVASVIPLALLFAISMMQFFGVSGNLMSLGAIDFGLIVDGAVIIVEAIIHGLQKITGNKRLTQEEMDEQVYESSSKIRTSAAFGEIIILIVYLPILALVGIEGKMFGPMAQTVSFAILGAFILSLTYVPMMSALFLSKKVKHKKNISDKIIDATNRVYQKVLTGALKVKGLIVGTAFILFIGAVILFQNMGGEFIPTLEEGDIATHIIIPPGSSLEQEITSTTKAEQLILQNFPEVEQVVSKIGSAEVPTDPMPMEVADMMVIFKPKSEWTTASTREEMVEKMEAVLDDLPGVTTEFSQPIQMRFNELMTGVRSDVGIKIFGEDIDLLVGYGDQVVSIIQEMDGVVDARAEAVSGLPQITVNYDKDKLALYGLNVGEINQMIRTGFAGEQAGVVYEGEKRFDLVVRLLEDSRNTVKDVEQMYVNLPSGNQIPLGQVADVKIENGPAQISREKGKRRIIIGFNVRGRDVQTVVNEIQEKLKAELDLPPGYFVEYTGQFENLVAANQRLMIAVPIALFVILILLFFTFGNLKQSLLIFTAIPLAAIGGVVALWLRDMPFSISAGVGFIALFGVAVLNGIVLLGYFNQLKKEGMNDVLERIKYGTQVRLRPVIMTAAVASLGFLPMAISTSAGAEVQKPLATVVIGGLVTATLLTLVVLPILYYYLEKGLFLKKGKVKKVLMVVLLLTSSFSWGQISLNEAIETGLKNNPGVKRAQLNIEQQQALTKTAYQVPKTSFTATYGQINTFYTDQSYAVNQAFNPFLFKAKSDLMNGYVSLATAKEEEVKQQLIWQIRLAWNAIVYAKSVVALLSQKDSLYSEFQKQAQVKFKAGETSMLEKSTADMLAVQATQEKLNSAMQLENARDLLTRLLVLETVVKIDQDEIRPLPFNPLIDSTEIFNNPILKIVDQEMKLAEKQKKANRSEAFPDITLGYVVQSFTGEQTVDGQTVEFDQTPRFQAFSVGLNIPLFYGAYKGKTKAATLAAEMESLRHEELQQQLRQELKNQVRALIRYQEEMVYYEQVALKNSEYLVNAAALSYQNGDIGYLAYHQAIQAGIQVKLDYIKAIKNYNENVCAVNYLIQR
jgi:cobalt-zinc-cadmium resistance protein CzcA